MTRVPWITLVPNQKYAWLTEGLQADFDGFLPIASKETKASKSADVQTIFKIYSLGIATNRDEWMYDFSSKSLGAKAARFIENYNAEVGRWIKAKRPAEDIEAFVNLDATYIKWTDRLKTSLANHKFLEFDDSSIRKSAYRPFTRNHLYFDNLLNQRRYQQQRIFPSPSTETENLSIVIGGYGRKEFSVLVSDTLSDLNFYADPAQCFPLYTYAVGGKIRRDNITDWALGQFQAKYGPSVTKRDIFHYVYALLHHPDYRERYKENLKRELPRLPLVADADGTVFQTYVTVGAELAALHVGYEDAAEYPLKEVVADDVPFSWRVTKMRLSADKTAVKVNDSLTLTGLPPEAFGYKLGNRSALEWVLDQYQVTTDKRSGLVSDPNRADAPDYIAHLVRRVVTVSVETQKRVGRLPGL